MELSEDQQRKTIERRILSYLLENPEARDTSGGIQNWWLRGDVAISLYSVGEALNGLVKQGWMDVRPTGREGGEDAQVYGIRAGKVDAIHSFLSRTSEPDFGPAPSPVRPDRNHPDDSYPDDEEMSHG